MLRVDPTQAWREKIGRKAGTDEEVEAQKKQLARGNIASKWKTQD